MKEKVYALTEQDFLLFREMKEWFRRQTGNTRNRSESAPEIGQTPDVYVARAPSPGGIPAMSTGTSTTGSGTGTVAQDDAPGHADCWVFRLDSSGEMESVHFSQTVYNISTTAVVAGTWVIIQRDKWGDWWANGVGSSSGGGGTTGATFVGPVHVVGNPLSGTSDGWYCQDIHFNGGNKWLVSAGPVNYLTVYELNQMLPRMEDTDATVGAQTYANTLLYKDSAGYYFIDYPRLSDHDTITFPATFGCVGTSITPLTYTTVKVVWDNFTNFPNIDVRCET